MTKQNPFNFSLSGWRSWCEQQALPKFVAKQIFEWVYAKGHTDPDTFTNLKSSLREALKSSFDWSLFDIDSQLHSEDGSQKFILQTTDGHLFEMVLMPYASRVTLCISCQVGCKMGCTFCQTGKMGLKRHLSSGEILMQLLLANKLLKQTEQRVTNIVFMGMGEPLDNYEEVIKACQIMVDPNGFGLSKTRVTISTAGLVPEIVRLGKELPLRLAISLHTADDAKRSQMMPINRKYNLETLKEALAGYPAPKGITFEYVMIEGQNDTIQDAKKLVKFVHGLKAKVNLIPLNPFPGKDLAPSHESRIKAFQQYLSARSIPAPVRYSRGQDVSGACGQLAAKRKEEIHEDPRTINRKRRQELTCQT